MNGWVNNREAGDLRRHRAHCDVIVMYFISKKRMVINHIDTVHVYTINRGPVNSTHKWPVTRKMFSIWWRHHVIQLPFAYPEVGPDKRFTDMWQWRKLIDIIAVFFFHLQSQTVSRRSELICMVCNHYSHGHLVLMEKLLMVPWLISVRPRMPFADFAVYMLFVSLLSHFWLIHFYPPTPAYQPYLGLCQAQCVQSHQRRPMSAVAITACEVQVSAVDSQTVPTVATGV